MNREDIKIGEIYVPLWSSSTQHRQVISINKKSHTRNFETVSYISNGCIGELKFKEFAKWAHRPVKNGQHFEQGCEVWYKNDEMHREDGPAFIISENEFEYWINGKKHRIDGPAVIMSNRLEYWIEGKRHRDDGPSLIIGRDRYYYIDALDITKKVKKWLKENSYPRWENENSWDDSIKMHFKLMFG